VYKHSLERTGARTSIRAVKTRETQVRFCLLPQGIRSSWLKRHADVRELAGHRHDGRRLGSFLHSLSMMSSRGGRREDVLSHGGGRWDDPGLAGESVRVRSREAPAAAAVGRLGTDPMVPADDTGTLEDGTISVKAPPAVA